MSIDTTTGFRLSFQQEQFWDWRRRGGISELRCALELSGALDVASLRSAIADTVARHEILRTHFVQPVGLSRPLQAPRDEEEPAWDEHDLRDAVPIVREATLETLWHAVGQDHPGAATRCTLVELTPTRHALLIGLSGLCGDSGLARQLVSEVAQRYAGTFAAIEDPVQYADYAEWQHTLLTGDDADAQVGRAHWEQRTTSPASMRLPWELTAECSEVGESRAIEVRFRPGLQQQIEARSHECGLSAEVFVLAAWEVLIGRLTGQSNVELGYVADGRNHEELSDAQGLFRRVLPVRCALDLNLPFTIVLEDVAAAVDAATRNQDYLPQVEACSAEPGIGFAWEVWPTPQEAAGVRIELTRLEARTEPSKLQLVCTSRNDDWQVELRYAANFYDRADVERVAQYLERLLGGTALDPSAPAGAIALLDANERDYLVSGLNHTTSGFAQDRCVHELIEEQAARNPLRVAIVCSGQERTYEQLNRRANQVASWLRQRGVGPNSTVGLCVERSVDLLAGLLGILKAGGAYIPLDPSHPPARWAQQLLEARANAVVTQTSLAEQLPGSGWTVLALDGDRAVLDGEPETNLASVNTPDDLAYVIYTSGSTGTSKGVGITHRNLVNYTNSICDLLKITSTGNEALRFGHVSTIAADLGNTSLYPALASGGCLQLLTSEAATDSQAWLAETGGMALDILKITPSHLNALMASPEAQALVPRRHLILGGEAASWELIERVRTLSACRIVNHYGPTETTVGVLAYPVPRDRELAGHSATVPIGRPLANAAVFLLDAARQPVPMGVPGELYVAGAGVAREYLNQPALTAERFVSLSFGADPAVRAYRTGDLARYLPDGNIEFLGRVDDQVKVRGYRVEPGEIASVLAQHPSVQQAVVLARTEGPGDVRLTAYLLAPALAGAGSEIVTQWAAERLPDYMLPASVIVLDRLPLTANGKVDRGALAKVGGGASPRRTPGAPPRTPTEKAIAEIWSQVLACEDIGVDDNFFALGGHSLLAIQVVNRIRSVLGVQLPLHVLFESPTLAGVATASDEALAAGTVSARS